MVKKRNVRIDIFLTIHSVSIIHLTDVCFQELENLELSYFRSEEIFHVGFASEILHLSSENLPYLQ